MTTRYPVDSTYHPCCNAIGQHDCRVVAAPDLPLPAGATADNWESVTPEGVPVRSLLWLDLGEVEVSGCQYGDDGRVERGIAVYLPECRHFSSVEARALAAKLTEAADALETLR